jgi:Domain of unknown function (DUF4440)
MRLLALSLCVAILLALHGLPQTSTREYSKAEILNIHEADRNAHLRGDPVDLISRVGPELISVAGGRVTRQTHQEVLKFMQDYFGSTKYSVWEDIEPPLVRVSSDGKMAWAIYNVRAKYVETKDGKPQPAEFIGAWMSAYERREGKWQMTAVTSTFDQEHK